MKVDLTKALLNFKGELLKINDQNVLVKDILCSALSSVVAATKDEKLQLDSISKQVWTATGEIELAPEDLVLIRKNIEHLPAGIFTQIYNLLG